ncbi:MAG: alpha/beta fold hydrolase [Betaproteobacteria bacterium]
MRGFLVFAWGLLASIVAITSNDASAFSPRLEDRLIRVKASDAQIIPLRLWGKQDAPAAIILCIHGFSDYARGFGHMLAALDTANTSLMMAFDQRGFGETASRGQWAGHDVMISDLHDVLLYIGDRYPGLPVHVVGESMGAALLLVAMHHPKTSAFFKTTTETNSAARQNPSTFRTSRTNSNPQVQSSILLAPAVWGWSAMPWYQVLSLKLFSQLLPDLRLSSQYARRIGVRPTDDPAVAAYLGKDPLMLRDIPVSMIAGLSDLMSEASLLMPKKGHRSLVVIGTRDEVIPGSAYCAWLAKNHEIATGQWLVQKDGFHMLTRQMKSDAILISLSNFLTSQLHQLEQDPPPMKALKC